jgi:energy-coupling factor transporter transmembrane protein EcfT
MKQGNTYHKKAKEFFDKIGLERTSEDFTAIVMGKILAEPEMVKRRILRGLPYYLAAVLFIATILAIPFNKYLTDFINNLYFRASSIDLSFVNDFFASITDLIKGYYITPTVIIISVSGFILLFTMTVVDYAGYFRRILRIQI